MSFGPFWANSPSSVLSTPSLGKLPLFVYIMRLKMNLQLAMHKVSSKSSSDPAGWAGLGFSPVNWDSDDEADNEAERSVVEVEELW